MTKADPRQMSLFQKPARNATWVARHLGTSPQTVCRLIEDGTLEAFKLREGGPWHILMESLERYEQNLREKYSLATAQKAVAR